jgi:O-antigen/teichoic acid export membrane protein
MRSTSLAGYTMLALLSRVFSVISVLLLARALTPSNFGYYAFLQTSATVIVTFTTFNLPAPIAVVLARGGRERLSLENAILAGILATAFGLAMVASVGCAYLTFPRMPLDAVGLAWFMLLTGLTALQLLSGAALIARGQRLRSAGASLLGAIAMTITLALSHALSLTEALKIASLSMALGAVLSTALLLARGVHGELAYVQASFAKFMRRSGRQVLLFSLLSFAASLSFQFALWFLQRQLLVEAGAAQSAVFALGNQFYNVVIFLPGIFGPLLLRHLGTIQLVSGQAGEAKRAGLAACGLAALGVVLFVAIGPWILQVLPTKYQVGVEPLALAVAAGALMFAKFPFSVFFQARILAAPELYAAIAGAVILIAGACVPHLVDNANSSMALRVTAHFVQFAVVAIAFALAVKRQIGKEHAVG